MFARKANIGELIDLCIELRQDLGTEASIARHESQAVDRGPVLRLGQRIEDRGRWLLESVESERAKAVPVPLADCRGVQCCAWHVVALAGVEVLPRHLLDGVWQCHDVFWLVRDAERLGQLASDGRKVVVNLGPVPSL